MTIEIGPVLAAAINELSNDLVLVGALSALIAAGLLFSEFIRR